MPEARHGQSPRTSVSKFRIRFLRWSVLGIGWTTYILYRSFVVGQIKYDPDTKVMVIRPRNIWIKRIALILKVFLAMTDNFGLHYFLYLSAPTYIIMTNHKDNSNRILEHLLLSVLVLITTWNAFRLYYWLRSLTWNRCFVRSVNEVILIMSSVEGIVGPIPLEGAFLLIMYLVQLQFTVLQMIEYARKQWYLFVLNTLLIEMFYNAYVAYQLLLLSWIGSMKRFLENYHRESLPIRQQRLKLLQLIRLYSRISNDHQSILVLWLPLASILYSHILILVCHWAAIIHCIVFSHQVDVGQKWVWILGRHLGGAVAPLLQMFFIGLCNDRIAQLEKFLNLQVLIIEFSHPINPGVQKGEAWEARISKTQTCFDLQLRAQPIRTQIMMQVCSCCFVLEFFFCTLLYAFIIVQYRITRLGSAFDGSKLRNIARSEIF